MNNEQQLIKMSSELVQNNIEKIVEGLYKIGSDNYKRLKIKTGSAFKNYLSSAVKKYSKIKTVLYRDEPVSLYDFYIDLDVCLRQKTKIDTSNIRNILEINERIIITGTAGCGKSTLFKHLFLNSITTNKHIPLYIELKDLNDEEIDLFDFIYSSISNLNFNLEKKYFDHAMSNGNFIFFFDGFDEVHNSVREIVTRQILNLADRYSGNKFLISSRPDEEFIAWNSFTEIKVLPLTKEKAKKLVRKIDYDIETKDNFVRELDKRIYNDHKSFVSNPLLLTIMLMTYNQFANIPEKMHIFYEQAFETLFFKHDATKSGYKRIMKSELAIDEFKRVLSAFAILSYFQHDITFDLKKLNNYLSKAKQISEVQFDEIQYKEDLLKSVCILVQDGLLYTYAHRTFQEYFTALYIANSPDIIQKQLFNNMLVNSGFGLRRDKVIEMLFEIDKNMVERNFIIPIIEEIKRKIDYSKETLDCSYLKFLKLVFSYIEYEEENNEEKGRFGYSIGDECYYIEFIQLVYSKYNLGTEELIAVCSQLEDLKYDINLLRKYSVVEESIRIDLRNIEQYPDLAKQIVRISHSFLSKLDFAINIREDLKKQHEIKSKSIEEILLKDKKNKMFFNK